MKIFFLILCFYGLLAYGYETDQYTSQMEKIKDSNSQLDSVVNEVIKDVARNWKGEKDPYRFTVEVQRNLWKRQMEYWVNENKEIDKYETTEKSIYKSMDFVDSPAIAFKGTSPTVSVDGKHFGTDKLSHFFGMGGWYYEEIEHFKKPKVDALKIGTDSEKGAFGELTTGVYSNADLVANYEGYLFFKSLSEDGINGKESIIDWSSGKPKIRREFTFSDHVNDYWNEALFPNHYINNSVLGLDVRSPDKVVKNNIRYYLCSRPESEIEKAFTIKNEKELKEKYSLLKNDFKSGEDFNVIKICDDFRSWPESKKKSFLEDHKELLSESSFPERISLIESSKNDLDIDQLLSKFSHLPMCSGEIKRADQEYEIIDSIDKVFSNQIHDKLISFLNTCHSIGLNDFKDLENFSDQIMSIIQHLVGKNITIASSENAINLVSKINGNKVESELKFSDINEQRFCFNTILPLDTLKNQFDELRPDGQAISVKHCYEKDPNTNAFNLTRQYHVEQDYLNTLQVSLFGKTATLYKSWEGHNFSSNENFIKFDDRQMYIYRTINYLCKWY